MKHFGTIKPVILSVFLLFSFASLNAQARYLFSPGKDLGSTEIPQPKHLSIPLEASYYNDGTATMRCNQIPSSYFHPISCSFSPGFYKGVLWVELAFKDTQAEDDQNFFLVLGNEHIDIAELFIMRDGEWQLAGRTGRSLRRDYMSVPSWRQVIPLDESQMSDGPVHRVRIRMCAYLGAPVSFSLLPLRNYNHTNMILTTFNFAIIALCLVLVAYILVIGLVFRDSAYIILSITAFLQFLLMLQVKGIGQVFIWNFMAVIPHFPRMTYLLTFAELSMTAATFQKIVGETMDIKIFRLEMGGIIVTGSLASLMVFVTYSPAVVFAIYSLAVISMCLALFSMWVKSLKMPHSDVYHITYMWIPMLILFLYVGVSNLLRFSVTIPRMTKVLNRDLFLYDFILLSMCIPAARVTAVRMKRKIDGLRLDLENCEKTISSINEERMLFFAVTGQLLKLSNTITNAFRLPQMQSQVDKVRKIQGLVERSAIQSNDYLTAMMAFEKDGQAEINRIILKSFYDSCVEAASVLARRKKIKIGYKPKVGEDVIVLANQSLLEIIFTNSLCSAIRYSRPGSGMGVVLSEDNGLVTVRMSCVTDPSVHEIIKNQTGENFLQDDEDVSNEISFRLVRKILGLYDGRLIQEETERGFDFTIKMMTERPTGESSSLPLLSTKFEGEYNKEIANSDFEPSITDDFFSVEGKPPSILLVEENITVAKFMEGLLHGHCMLYTMSTGADAWNFLQSGVQKPDIIISNYTLPVISGLELFRKCSDVPFLQDIPFIFLLPVSQGARQSEFIKRGAAACLVPPFTKDELFRSIYTVFSLSKKIQRTLLSRVNEALYGNAPKVLAERSSVSELADVVPSGNGYISLTETQKKIFADFGLSPREQQIAMMISRGLSDKEIADELNISPGTVTTHKKNIFKKLEVHSRIELMGKVR